MSGELRVCSACKQEVSIRGHQHTGKKAEFYRVAVLSGFHAQRLDQACNGIGKWCRAAISPTRKFQRHLEGKVSKADRGRAPGSEPEPL